MKIKIERKIITKATFGDLELKEGNSYIFTKKNDDYTYYGEFKGVRGESTLAFSYMGKIVTVRISNVEYIEEVGVAGGVDNKEK